MMVNEMNIIDEIEMRRNELNKYHFDLLYANDEMEDELMEKEKELRELIQSHTFSRDEIIGLVGNLTQDENRYFENPSANRIYDLLCEIVKNSEHTNEDGKLVVEIDDEVYSNFYSSATRSQSDGWNRALWIDIEDGRMWTTTESKNTIIENLKNTIFCVESVYGDNNLGVDSVCMDCYGCRDAYMDDKDLNDYDLSELMEDLYSYVHYGKKYSYLESLDVDVDEFIKEHNITKGEITEFYYDTYCSWYNNQFDDCVMEYAEINEHEYRFIEFERV